jgi:pimeloyl-ACP methyl ester carboxylesterase
MPRWLRIVLWTAAAVLAAALLFVGYFFLPIGDPDLSSHPDPAKTYEDAVERIERWKTEEAEVPLQDVTRSVALLHGKKTDKAVVIFHGFTHSPYQWRLVDKAYYEQGYNVWVPLAPYHGYADRLTDDPSKLTPERLRDYADRAVDIGAGLGDKVEVVGLSTGGVAALWADAERPDVARTISIAPLMGPKWLPPWLIMPLVRFFRALPMDFYNWWTPEKEKMPGPAYPRFSFKGVFAFAGLGQWVAAKAQGPPPAKGFTELVANWADKTVNTEYNVEVARRLGPPGKVLIHQIPAALGIGHDLVEPDGENKAIVARVYPVLANVLGIALPSVRRVPDPANPGSLTATTAPAP